MPYSGGMRTEAVNFSGTYPLAGERIGPAWRECWKLLEAGRWTSGNVLARDVAPRFDLNEKTVQNLLREAKKAGQLQMKLKLTGGRNVAHYRPVVISTGLM